MFYVYLVASAALIPIINNFKNILRQPYSWYLVPLLFIGFFVGFVIIHAAVFAVWTLLVNVNKPQTKPAACYRKTVTSTLRLVMKLARVKIHVSGAEKLPENEHVMLVSNHIDDTDPAIFLAALPELELGFIAKKDVYTEMKFVAKAIHRLCGYPIDREHDREAAKTVIKAVSNIKNGLSGIGIFPEGKVSVTKELLPFRNGAFKIATRSGAKVVACTVWGTPKILKELFFRRTDIYLDILAVVDPKDYENTSDLGDHLYEIMKQKVDFYRNGELQS